MHRRPFDCGGGFAGVAAKFKDYVLTYQRQLCSYTVQPFISMEGICSRYNDPISKTVDNRFQPGILFLCETQCLRIHQQTQDSNLHRGVFRMGACCGQGV
jgi:hypothetical protein